MIDEGLQAESANDYVVGIIQLFLWVLVIGLICRCILILLKGATEGKPLAEIIQLLKARIFAVIMAASLSGILKIIEGAYK